MALPVKMGYKRKFKNQSAVNELNILLSKQGKHVMKQTSIQDIRIFKLFYTVQTLIYFYKIKIKKLKIILWSHDFKNCLIRKDKDGDWCQHSVTEQ